MENPVNPRKIEHIEIINKYPEVDRKKNYFDRIFLKHRALPELDYNEIDTSIEFLGKRLTFPLLISSMTGGDHELIRKINKNLAIAARETGVALAVGSQRVMFTSPEALDSFRLRQFAPETLLFSNLGAVQLNYGFGLAECQKAMDILQADALYLHLNPLQEVLQPEGDRNFSQLAEKIGQIAEKLEKPVIVKEVGAGISRDDAILLIRNGIKFIDVAGSGGTSWSRIEHYRQINKSNQLGLTFQDWGIPTPLALMQLNDLTNQIVLIASGGLRNGIHMVKSIILGARLCGIARSFLNPATKSPEAVISVIEQLRTEFKTTMFLLGIKTVSQLFKNDNLILKEELPSKDG